MMRTFSINTLGCKVNQYEGQQIRELLERHGLRKARGSAKPDLLVVHTCCVTHTASAKSRHCIRKVLKQNPDGIVLVSGCLPTAQIGELSTLTENVHVVRNRSDLPAALTSWAQSRIATPVSQSAQSCPNICIKAQNSFKIKHKKELSHNSPALSLELPPLTSFKEQTRAFLKVQDGCDRCCSYCIVPQTRPVVHSKPVEIALREAQALVESGHREIVITGVFLGAYGQKSARPENWPDHRNNNLADLIDKMAQVPNLTRIRLSSLEPSDVTDRLLDTLAEHRNITPHLHLSLQSGSDYVLRRMCRRYKADEFRKKVESIKARLDRPAITTDIIVGFPGESEADFEQTVDLAKSVRFAKMHVFTFSPRKNTPAENMQGFVENRIMKKRSQKLRDLDVELGKEYRRQFLGETAQILIESQNDGRQEERTIDESSFVPRLCGRSERYFKVYLDKKRIGPIGRIGPIVKAELIEHYKDGLLGVVF
jgi:threonylcarbamoyladenosine tRNA methylthiotransferase MtaB